MAGGSCATSRSAGEGYPFDLPVADGLRRDWLTLGPGVTFLVGENGSGKSTPVEGIAVAAGFDAEGGSRSFRFATRSGESSPGRAVRTGRERTSFFLRAESYGNLATEIERLDRIDPGRPLMPAYGGTTAHERSHGESFLDLLTHRFRPGVLYPLDEPEAALSTRGCLRAPARIDDLVRQGRSSSSPPTPRSCSPCPARGSWRSPTTAPWLRPPSTTPSPSARPGRSSPTRQQPCEPSGRDSEGRRAQSTEHGGTEGTRGGSDLRGVQQHRLPGLQQRRREADVGERGARRLGAGGEPRW